MRIELTSIEMDTSIQCRASIDTATVSEYAERMTEGDEFPPIVVYGTKDNCWIADGWHRVMAARQIGAADIPATLCPGGRVDALKAALSANAAHGIRRTNADKRRSVEIALREFPRLSSRQIAQMCGVSHDFVSRARPLSSDDNAPTRTTSDGRQYPATRREVVDEDDEEEAETQEQKEVKNTENNPVSDAEQYASMAIRQLQRIRKDDPNATKELDRVSNWIAERKEA